MSSPFLNETKKARIFQTLYDNSLDLYRTIDLDGTITLCNKTYAEKLGYELNEVLGHSIFEHVADKSFGDLKQTYEHWKKTGCVANSELWLKRKDGTTFPVLLSVSNLYDSKGDLIGSNTVIRDISELSQIKSEVEALKQKKLAIIGELSARISHDLKNPLAVIKSSLDLLYAFDDPSLDKHDKIFQKIDRAVLRISHQIEEVMDYVKPKPLKINSHSIQKILSDVVDGIGKQENVTISLPQNDVKINCDDEKLEIVFTNLFLNAIQAMDNCGTITLQIIEEPNNVKIEVQDSGPGIPEDVKDKVFEPLFTTRQIGTGLGLPSCKAIIEKHGGKISFRTKVGEGTTFVIELPKNPS